MKRAEIDLSDKHRVTIQVHAECRPAHVDLRAAWFGPVTEKVWKGKDKNGEPIFELLEYETWRKASQGLQIPIDQWSNFVKAVTEIEPPSKGAQNE